MFISALGSITGQDNRLRLPKVRSAAVLMIDGLGSGNIRQAAGHAPFLNGLLAKSSGISSVFPTTTAAALTSLGTGLMPGQHGVLGYSVLNPQNQKPLNMLNGWGSEAEPELWQANQTVAMKGFELGVDVSFVGPEEYENSGFTRVFMRGAKYLPAKSIEERLNETAKLLSSRSSQLVYCYVPELDQIAHAFGVDSSRWLACIEDLSAGLSSFAGQIPPDAGALLTADHGVLDVSADHHIFLDEAIPTGLLAVTGDPRCQFLYLIDASQAPDMAEKLNERLGGRAIAVLREQVVHSGLYGESVSRDIELRMPDIFVIAIKKCAIYHRDFAPPKSLNMVGQHGGLSDLELQVPLIRLGGYA